MDISATTIPRPEYFNDRAFPSISRSSKKHSKTSKRAQPFHILIVEDNNIEQHIYRVIVEERGFECTIVGTGKEALEQFAKGDYHAMILDVGLPDMTGIDVCEKIRQAELKTHAHLPILVMTAYGDMVEEQCRKAGCDDFATKPVLEASTYDHFFNSWLPKNPQ
ncbi:MAG: response regulator [Gammaproteobacteria bacterium]|nr:response regulator [Gammaproteobacteria bacterium]